VTTIADRDAPYYQPSLPDIGHQILPYWSYYQFNNWWIIISYVFVFIRFIPQADIRITVFRRWFFVQGLMFGMRCISIYVTSLTVPQPGCITNITELKTPAVEAFYVMFGIHSTCGDVLFSGHTVACKYLFIINYY
jgi:ABC-type thiamin/hydroxymethylpyrimidine transport system permease subunit